VSLDAAGAALAAAAARLAALGWMRGTAGNLSLVLQREPLRLAVTASGIDKGALTAADAVLIDERGAAIDPAETRRPSAEGTLHARIAALTGAGAVVHIHPLAAVLAADAHPAGLTLEGLEMLKGIGRAAEGDRVRLPVVPNSQDMAVLGDRVAAALEPGVPAVLVARHGLYTWGADLEQACQHAEIIVWLLEFVNAGGAPTRRG
jgi:methylthioribulose-1-phosphate dehydratase